LCGPEGLTAPSLRFVLELPGLQLIRVSFPLGYAVERARASLVAVHGFVLEPDFLGLEQFAAHLHMPLEAAEQGVKGLSFSAFDFSHATHLPFFG